MFIIKQEQMQDFTEVLNVILTVNPEKAQSVRRHQPQYRSEFQELIRTISRNCYSVHSTLRNRRQQIPAK